MDQKKDQTLAARWGRDDSRDHRTRLSISLLLFVISLCSASGFAQTAATGALSGTVTDQNKAVVAGAEVKVINEVTSETRTAIAKADGTYVAPLLPPGSYRVEVAGRGFKRGTKSGIRIEVTETTTLEIQLEVGAADESMTVTSDAAVVQTESSALGRVTNEKVVVSLPLATRNYTDILGLSAGVNNSVANAAELGRGTGGTSGTFGNGAAFGGSGTYVHGARSYENNFQMNGVGINDLQSNGAFTGGVAIPNADTIQEFKVQTGLYDAAFGRNAGANVNVITKSGSNQFHGTAFEFFRNEALNANDFFFNRNGRKKGVLRQNQYGFTLGGPVVKDKLLFFGSFQGNRQLNGIAGGGTASVFGPPLTNDRSAAALGRLFAGQRGAFGGTAILADGSNINPIALRLLQLKLPDGSLVIPTPQVINPSQPFAQQGFSVFSTPSTFNENQYLVNLDFLHTAKSKFEGRFFAATSDRTSFLGSANVPGFLRVERNEFRNFSLAHTYTFGSNLFNEARLGFHRILLVSGPSQTPFSFSDLGITAPPQTNSTSPFISISGSYGIGNGAPQFSPIQNHLSLQDTLSYVRGKHTLRAGGDISYSRVLISLQSGGSLTFSSFPDLLLGLSGAQNGSGSSNIFNSFDSLGNPARDLRARDGFLFLQDDYKVTRRLTLNLGLRYERIGALSDASGRNANFNVALANPNPPAAGSLNGFVVASNFVGTVPAGVTKLDHDLVINGEGQNTFAPRLGFAWQVLPNSSRVVLRGGYGLYYSRLPSQTVFQLNFGPPFALSRSLSGAANAAATFSNPFQPDVPLSSFPIFFPYSPTTALSLSELAPDYRPSKTQQYSLNIQSQLARDFLLEVGYVGTRGTNLLRTRSANQALLASPSNPIRGETTNTVANLALRVPIRGFTPDGIRQIETAGESRYNGLEVSLSKRFSRGLQLLASYTFSKALDTDGANVDSTGNGRVTLGDQNDPRARYGRSAFDRTHRFVLSYVYEFPIPADRAGLLGKALGGWALSGVTTIQTGQALTLTAFNANNLFGINGFGADRAQLASGCTYAGLTTSGGVSQRVSNYFNTACFTTAPVIGDPEVSGPNAGKRIATGFGNSGVGIVDGPGQNNTSLALIKRTSVRWPTEASNLEFRAEFFNAFNHPQFSNPGTTFGLATFGQITSTFVNPRIIQFALKFNF